jgi:hypothetical protein
MRDSNRKKRSHCNEEYYYIVSTNFDWNEWKSGICKEQYV